MPYHFNINRLACKYKTGNQQCKCKQYIMTNLFSIARYISVVLKSLVYLETSDTYKTNMKKP